MNVSEVAELTGVSVRTLHHYDQIGLLCPKRNPENGYREYSDGELDLLQQILFFRECGFSLASIQTLLASPTYDRDQVFALQRNYLLREKRRIDAMLGTLEKTMKASKGELTMTPEEKFAGFDFTDNPYEEEARRLWGDEKVDQSNRKIAALTADGRKAITKEMHDLFTELAALRHEAPDSAKAQAAMEEMYRYFNRSFAAYTPEAFAGLGQMYIADERFTKNIDRYGEGLSRFLAEAMAVYASRKAAP
jgi:DNA-binding transcriptional MerR regulator